MAQKVKRRDLCTMRSLRRPSKFLHLCRLKYRLTQGSIHNILLPHSKISFKAPPETNHSHSKHAPNHPLSTKAPQTHSLSLSNNITHLPTQTPPLAVRSPVHTGWWWQDLPLSYQLVYSLLFLCLSLPSSRSLAPYTLILKIWVRFWSKAVFVRLPDLFRAFLAVERADDEPPYGGCYVGHFLGCWCLWICGRGVLARVLGFG